MPLDVRLSTSEAFRHSPGTLAVGDTPRQVLPADPVRKGFILVNNGYAPCYWSDSGLVSAGSTASATGGGLINAEGDYLSGSQVDGYTGEVWAVCATGQSTVVFARAW